jgi:hypothetical protein
LKGLFSWMSLNRSYKALSEQESSNPL